MVKINKPPRIYQAQMLIKYLGRNSIYNQKRTLTPIKIKEFNTDLGEGLVVQHTMFDGTEVLFSMLSGNLYIKKRAKFNSNYKKKKYKIFVVSNYSTMVIYLYLMALCLMKILSMKILISKKILLPLS